VSIFWSSEKSFIAVVGNGFMFDDFVTKRKLLLDEQIKSDPDCSPDTPELRISHYHHQKITKRKIFSLSLSLRSMAS